jgi:hypothetical protein
MGKVKEGWRKFHNEELHNLHFQPNIIGTIMSCRTRWAREVACMEEKRTSHTDLVGKSERKWPVEKPRRRC